MGKPALGVTSEIFPALNLMIFSSSYLLSVVIERLLALVAALVKVPDVAARLICLVLTRYALPAGLVKNQTG